MKSTSCWSVLNILLAILILFSSPRFCFARDNITVKTRLADGETLVSAGNRFELEFFGPSTTSSVKRYGTLKLTDEKGNLYWSVDCLGLNARSLWRSLVMTRQLDSTG
ncbi:hypothetical protein V6N12_042171 [Hibiscus sabdariffa]|uniref:Uncharacterized protein n=1 Tax=Hibiscus sabdariffa TaxID=183260 RepID=A0ABR2EE01_9ROSI